MNYKTIVKKDLKSFDFIYFVTKLNKDCSRELSFNRKIKPEIKHDLNGNLKSLFWTENCSK